MPIYEYECNDCRSRFERRQGFHDEPVAECPECKGKVRRLIHPAPIIFKGSGFYVTDSRGRNPAADTPASADTTDAGESGAATEKASAGASAPQGAVASKGAAASKGPEKTASGGEAGETGV